jgi:hypothetical protein
MRLWYLSASGVCTNGFTQDGEFASLQECCEATQPGAEDCLYDDICSPNPPTPEPTVVEIVTPEPTPEPTPKPSDELITPVPTPVEIIETPSPIEVTTLVPTEPPLLPPVETFSPTFGSTPVSLDTS